MLKKICIISPDSYPLLIKTKNDTPVGGAETQLVTLGREFLSRNYLVVFFVDNFGQQEKLHTKDGIKIVKSPLRYMGGKNYYIFFDWIKLFYNLNREMADIHLLKLPNHLLFPIGLFCKIFRKKLYFICQIDRDVDLPTLRAENRLQYLLYRLGLRLTHAIITQNFKQHNSVTNSFANKCILIRNVLSFKNTKSFDKENRILWVGSNLPRKQPELFIKIAQILPQYKFQMIVSNSKQIPNSCNLRKICKYIDNIEFINGVPFSEIDKYFQKARLLVSTSISEGFPNVFLQAWQCATPVVSLSINPDNIINKYQLGRVSKTIEAMQLDIVDLMENVKLRKAIGKKCLKYVNEHHNTNDIVNQYCQLFNSSY